MDAKAFSDIIDRIDAELEAEHFEGYRDGHDTDAIAPNDNRSEAYRHSWRLGRLEREKQQLPPAWQSRLDAASIRAKAITEALAQHTR